MQAGCFSYTIVGLQMKNPFARALRFIMVGCGSVSTGRRGCPIAGMTSDMLVELKDCCVEGISRCNIHCQDVKVKCKKTKALHSCRCMVSR